MFRLISRVIEIPHNIFLVSKSETEVFVETMHSHTNKFTLYLVNIELESNCNSQQCFKKPDSKTEINQKISKVSKLFY